VNPQAGRDSDGRREAPGWPDDECGSRANCRRGGARSATCRAAGAVVPLAGLDTDGCHRCSVPRVARCSRPYGIRPCRLRNRRRERLAARAEVHAADVVEIDVARLPGRSGKCIVAVAVHLPWARCRRRATGGVSTVGSRPSLGAPRRFRARTGRPSTTIRGAAGGGIRPRTLSTAAGNRRPDGHRPTTKRNPNEILTAHRSLHRKGPQSRLNKRLDYQSARRRGKVNARVPWARIEPGKCRWANAVAPKTNGPRTQDRGCLVSASRPGSARLPAIRPPAGVDASSAFVT